MILFNRKKTILAACIAFVTASHSYAQTQTPSSPAESSSKPKPAIEEVFVTASRAEQSVDDVIASVSVMTNQDIINLQPLDLNDIFELQTGVDVLRTGSRGSVSSLQVRGASSSQTLMLVNGMRISSATLGTANYSLIPPELVAKVELLRGSASSLYGSEAIGGVFNISTHASAHAKTGVQTGLEYGSHNYHRAVVMGNAKGEQISAAVAVVREQSEGINSFISNSANNISDDDGYEREGGALNLSYKPDEYSELKLLSIVNNGKSEFDNSFNQDSLPFSDTKLSVHQLAASRRVNAHYKAELIVGRSVDEYIGREDNPEVTAFPSQIETTNQTMTWLNEININQHTLVVGYDNLMAKVAGTGNYLDEKGEPISRRQSQAAFVQANGRFGVMHYALGVRRDDTDNISPQNTPNVAASFNITSHQKFYARYAEGFRVPTFNDAFSPFGGNAALKPEESKNKELGYKIAFNSLNNLINDGSVAIAVYERDVTNLIVWRPQADGSWQPMNVGQTHFEGVELTTDVSVGALGSFTIAADYLNALDITDTTSPKKPLEFRAKRTLRAHWLKTLGAATLGLQAKMQSGRKVSEAIEPSGYTAGYGVLNATFAYKVNDVWLAQVKVGNVLNKTYTLNPSYNEDGTNWQFAVKAKF